MAKVLVLGASGLVGGNVLRYLRTVPGFEVVGTHYSFATQETVYFNTDDIADSANLSVLESFSPTVILHCGALTFVDYCEEHAEESYTKTVGSTLNAIKLAEQYGAKLVYISTDYVFDGVAGPYTEEAAVNPVCIYGKHKLEAEQQVIKSGVPSLILRITNVYGDEIRNKNFVSRLVQQIQEKKEISLALPYDQYATPINALDIARALELLLQNEKTGIYHLGSTDYMNRFQLADKIVGLLKYSSARLSPVTTASLKQVAPRPLKAGLLSHKFLSEFPDFRFSTVQDFLKEHTHA